MNRKVEVFIGSLIVLVVIAFIGINIFNTLVDEDRIITKISDAIINMDIDYLKDHIEIEGIAEPLTEEQISNIVNLLRERGYNAYTIKNLYGQFTDNIYLKKQGKENLLFDKYILVLRPYSLTIESNMPNSVVYLNDKEYGTIDDSRIINLNEILPGYHQLKVVYEGEFTTLENEQELVCFDRYDNDIYSYIPLDGFYVDVFSNFPQAKLYINDEETDIELDGYYTLGPVPTDGTLQIQAKVEIDGEIYSSEKVPIDGYYSIYELYIDYEEPITLDLPTNGGFSVTIHGFPDMYDAVAELMNRYQYSLVEAINYGDYSIVAPYIEEDSPLMSAQVNLVNRLYGNGTKEELLNYVIEDFGQFSDTVYKVSVFEEHRIYYSSGKEETVSNRYIYTVVLNGDTIYLRDIQR